VEGPRWGEKEESNQVKKKERQSCFQKNDWAREKRGTSQSESKKPGGKILRPGKKKDSVNEKQRPPCLIN